MGLVPPHMFFSLIIMMMIMMLINLSNGQDCGGSHIQKTVTVDQQQGKGDHQTISGAINSIDTNNNQWFKIHINPGTYYETIEIPSSKSCVILEGSSVYSTKITSGQPEVPPLRWNPTFSSLSNNVIVSGITFENSYNLEDGSKDIKQALAAAFYGNKTAIINCSFIGYQDTLFAAMGTHYFKNCYIQGETDFIFGAGQSYFENCMMNATQRDTNRSPGYVTAQRRESTNDPNGFVFRKGSVIGNGKVYLGRPWGPYPRVIFWETDFSSVVDPQGWNVGNFKDQTNQFTFVEADCTGEGANNGGRVSWMRKGLSDSEKNQYSLSAFTNDDGWVTNIPNLL